jgi:malate dehydrogenase (oxaloacetate-decarboxylating)(NADP+)
MTSKPKTAAQLRRELPRGLDLMRDPTLNKGTAFSDAERDAYGLRGLLPPHVATIEEQEERVIENLNRLQVPLNKYVALEALQDRNETLFYRVVSNHIDEMMPIIYTPTVGQACQEFGHIFRRSRGMYVTAADRGNIERVLNHWPTAEVDIIVVTDGERILGLGDLGASGMGIPIGKLSLYTACAGIHPARCLPVVLDVGTNRESLRNDPLYLGMRQARLNGADYDALVEEFVMAAQAVFPGVLIQFEDFANHHAFALLERYRRRVPCFNDDIQGTAAVTLAGLMSAVRVTGKKLADNRFLFLGAGEAATGIAELIAAAISDESAMSVAEARKRCYLFDSKGLVVASRTDLVEHKLHFAHDHAQVTDFNAAIEQLKPTGIIGVAANGGAFTEKVLRTMAKLNERPIIFALSNPTSKSECTAAQAYEGTDGRALFASGSPFANVSFGGKTFVPRQGNNSYVFPGIGLGAIVSRAREVTDEMFLAAARSLALQVSEADLAQGALYPPLSQRWRMRVVWRAKCDRPMCWPMSRRRCTCRNIRTTLDLTVPGLARTVRRWPGSIQSRCGSSLLSRCGWRLRHSCPSRT